MGDIMKELLLILGLSFISTFSFSKDIVVYKYKDKKNSSVLLSNKPVINKQDDLALVKAEKIIPTTETVHVPARDVYKLGWCKINSSLVPCYNYQNTAPAYSYKEPSTKAIPLNEKQIQESIEQYKQEQQDIAEQKKSLIISNQSGIE